MVVFWKNWGKVKIDHDYFSLNSKKEHIANFFRLGNWYAHLIDRIKWYFAPRFFLVFGFPSHIDIEASSRCQMKCPMCGRWLMKGQKQGDMDFGLYRKVIDECAKERVYSVKLSWRGEPLLNPRIVDMVRYAKEKGIKDVAFLTNGERLNFELIDQLINAGLDWISISFDGLGEIYERIRYPARFEKVIENIKYIRDSRNRQGLSKPLIRVQSIWSAIKDNPGEYLDFFKPIADKISFIADQIRSDQQRDFKHDPSYICQSPWQRMCVMWDGRVSQCHSDYLEGNILGDVNENSLRQIWRGEAFVRLRRLMKNKQRLYLKPCQICCDGGITREEVVQVKDKKIHMNVYADQKLDVEHMDARPGVKA